MSDLETVLFTLYLPLTLICVNVFIAGALAKHRGVKKALKNSAVVCFIVIGTVFALSHIADTTCNGGALFGFTNCTILPASIANFSFIALIIGIYGGAAYGILLVLITALVELRHHARTS